MYKGFRGIVWGGASGERGCLGCTSLEQTTRARKNFGAEGGGAIRRQWPRSFFVSLNMRPYFKFHPFTSVPNIPSPTISVPMFSLD